MQQLRESAAELAVYDVFEASLFEQGDELGWLGKVGDAFWQVSIGGAVGQEAADEWNNLAEVDAVSEADEWVVWHADIEEADATVWSNDTVQLGEEGTEIDEVAQGEPARDSIDTLVGHGKLEDVGLDSWGVTASGVQHAVRQVDRDGPQSRIRQVDAHISGAAREVEHGTSVG